jgi:hypothetical protein
MHQQIYFISYQDEKPFACFDKLLTDSVKASRLYLLPQYFAWPRCSSTIMCSSCEWELRLSLLIIFVDDDGIVQVY